LEDGFARGHVDQGHFGEGKLLLADAELRFEFPGQGGAFGYQLLLEGELEICLVLLFW